MVKPVSIFLLLLVCVWSPALGQRWAVWDFPNPQTQPNLCGRPTNSSVCDPNRVISQQNADQIDEMISDVYREPYCLCDPCRTKRHGHIIRVALMPQIERVWPEGENTTMGLLRDAQMYSYILTQRWRMEGDCNESLLILYSRNDGILYTLTRQTTRSILSDSDVKTISLIVRHFFDRPETIAAGIKEMIHRYRLVFEEKRTEAFQTSQG